MSDLADCLDEMGEFLPLFHIWGAVLTAREVQKHEESSYYMELKPVSKHLEPGRTKFTGVAESLFLFHLIILRLYSCFKALDDSISIYH